MTVGNVAVLILAALTGAALGSFAGVVAARGWRGALQGRSRCNGCLRELAWFELVPLVSYPALRGRCRGCGRRIRPGVYLWEVSGAAAATAIAIVLLALR